MHLNEQFIVVCRMATGVAEDWTYAYFATYALDTVNARRVVGKIPGGFQTQYLPELLCWRSELVLYTQAG